MWGADLVGGAIRLVPDESLILATRAIAFEIRHTIQDCLYVASALEAGCVRLVTADSAFHGRAVGAFPFLDLWASPRWH